MIVALLTVANMTALGYVATVAGGALATHLADRRRRRRVIMLAPLPRAVLVGRGGRR